MKRVRPSRQSLIRPMRNWGVTLVTNGGTAAVPPAAASSAAPVKNSEGLLVLRFRLVPPSKVGKFIILLGTHENVGHCRC